jgi:hypothetical protein
VPLDACNECQGNLDCIPSQDQLEGIFAKFDLKDTQLPERDGEMDQLKQQIKDDMIAALNNGGARVDSNALEITSITAITGRRRQSGGTLAVNFVLTKSSSDFGESNSYDLYQELARQMNERSSAIYQGIVTKNVVPGSLVLLSAFDCRGRPVSDREILDSGEFLRSQGGVCQYAQETLAPRAPDETRAPDVTRFPTRFPSEPPAPLPETLPPLAGTDTRAPGVTRFPTTFAPLDTGDTRAPEGQTLAPFSVNVEETRAPTTDVRPTPGPPSPTPGSGSSQVSVPLAAMLLVVMNILALGW